MPVEADATPGRGRPARPRTVAIVGASVVGAVLLAMASCGADGPDAPRISEATLIHELTHALQDQRHNLTSPRFSGETQDADLAVTGLYEGEAGYIEDLYRQRCDDDRWRCQRASPTSGDGGASNRGILTIVLQPYADGPGYVHHRLRRSA